jgi:hypothetical protein
VIQRSEAADRIVGHGRAAGEESRGASRRARQSLKPAHDLSSKKYEIRPQLST